MTPEQLEIADLVRVWHRKFGNKKKGAITMTP